MDFILNNMPALFQKLWEQIYLAGSATLIAMLIGIPAGIFISHKQKFKSAVLGAASILQTIPSLALLAFLLPFLGIGFKPALVALSVYALLPIISNTTTGIGNISPVMIEAANGLGFTRWQKLWMVELPLALPMIIAGIRTATIMSIGIATLAAFIGAGGLGDFIYQGLSLNNTPLILLGAIPAALLALIADFLIRRIESFIAQRHYKKFAAEKKQLGGFTILVILITMLCGAFFYQFNANKKNTVTIGTKNFTEQLILGEMMAQLIQEKSHLKVIRKFNLGGTLFCQRALVNGEIDLYPEYTGTAYTVILKHKKKNTPEKIYMLVKKEYRQRFQISWLKPFGFNNTQALIVRENYAKKNRLRTISDLASISKKITIAVPSDFLRRPDAYAGLKKTYRLDFKNLKIMDPGLMYLALRNKEVDASIAFSTDARIPAYHFRMLIDNKHFFPPYYAAPIIRSAVLKQHPKLKTLLEQLAGLISNKTMQNLNYQVDIEKKSPASVAREFLKKKGLI